MAQNWVVLFLIHAEDTKTKGYSDSLLAELHKTKFAEGNRVFILRDTYLQNNEEDLNAMLSELVYNKKGKKKELQLLKNFGKINIGNSSNLSRIFNLVKKQTGERNRFAIVTWDHGFAFGIFNGNPENNIASFEKNTHGHHSILANIKPAIAKNITGIDNNSALENLAPTENTDMLTPEEIAKALKASFSKKIDLFIMMNCWMQSVETCCALADTVKVLVAAESTVDFIGYDFKGFINELCDNPSISTNDLSAKIVKGIKRKYTNQKTEIAFSEIAVSSINLSGMKKLTAILDRVAGKLQKSLPSKLEDIKTQRAASFEFTNGYLPLAGIYFYYIVDLSDLLTKFGSVNLITKKDMASLHTWLKNYQIAKVTGKNFKPENSALSIYLPNNNTYTITSTYYYKFYSPKGPLKMRRKFARDSGWAIFIDAFNKSI